jgi:hypothetical protein
MPFRTPVNPPITNNGTLLGIYECIQSAPAERLCTSVISPPPVEIHNNMHNISAETSNLVYDIEAETQRYYNTRQWTAVSISMKQQPVMLHQANHITIFLPDQAPSFLPVEPDTYSMPMLCEVIH